MKYIQTLTGRITIGKPTSIENLTGNNISDEVLALHKCYPYVDNTDAAIPAGMKWAGTTTDTLTNGMVTRTNDVIPMTTDELATAKLEALASKLEEVRTIGRTKRAEIVADASPYEAASWTLKRGEAVAYNEARNANPPTHSPTMAPMLAMEAAVRVVSLDSIVDRVLANASALSQAEAAIAGSEGKHNDALALLDTIELIEAYDTSLGWAI